jgi:CRP-like cAMP-binding protein
VLSSNFLLASLSPADAASIQPCLRPVELEHKKILFEAGDKIGHVYFPTGAVISLVIGLSTGEMVEAAMVGKDGVVGAASALDGRISLSRAIVQLAGPALVCDILELKGAALQSHSFLAKLIRHEQTLYAQAQQSAACMAAHEVQARLSRWLLRARDLSGSDTLMFTQEFLAEMLAVRRTSVTVVAHTLQQAGLIKYSRGKIQIIDIEGLREAACECYESVKDHYALLLGDGSDDE